jgi:glycerophosphoryl diester phosphodiesterase
MLIFAHRGASGLEPENTIRAFSSALMAEVDGIEIDIHQVGDKLLVIHDRWLQTTTSGVGQLCQYNYEQLRLLDAGCGEVIPELNEVFSLIAGNCIINLELKNIVSSDILFRYLNEAIDNYNFSPKQILISSFNHPLLSMIHQQRNEFPIGALTSSIPLEYAKFAQHLCAHSVHINIDFINQRFVVDAHQRKIKVFVYTVNELEDLCEMVKLGVDGIFTNFPVRIKKHLSSLNLISANKQN